MCPTGFFAGKVPVLMVKTPLALAGGGGWWSACRLATVWRDFVGSGARCKVADGATLSVRELAVRLQTARCCRFLCLGNYLKNHKNHSKRRKARRGNRFRIFVDFARPLNGAGHTRPGCRAVLCSFWISGLST